MSTMPTTVPTTPPTTVLLRNALTPTGDVVDLTVVDGMITDTSPHDPQRDGRDARGATVHDLDGMLTMPSFVEPHAHLDKALTADEVHNPSGDLGGAVQAWLAERARRPAEDFAARAHAAVACQAQRGVTAIRSHVDIGAGVELRALEGLLTVKERWASMVDIELVGLAMPLTGPDGAATRAMLREALVMGLDVIGGVPSFEDDLDEALTVVLDLAEEFGRGVDLHTDEALDPTELTIERIAELVSARETPGVTASHLVSLGVQSEATQQRIAAAIAAADISAVTLPQTNLFLQARGQRTSPPRGLTALDALSDAGVTVAAGGDNLQDPFNTMGRGDPLEIASLMVTVGHRTPGAALDSVSTAGRSVMRRRGAGLAVGDAADLVAVDARTVREAIASAPDRRMTIFHGSPICNTSTTVTHIFPTV